MILLLFLLIILVIPKSRQKQTPRNVIKLTENAHIEPRALPRIICERLIHASKNMKFDESPEPVDDEPVYQINILEGLDVKNEKLWRLCKPIYDKYKNKKIKSHSDFVFIKRYLPNERVRIPLHHDKCDHTASFLLSSAKDFGGGKFYIFNEEDSEKLSGLSNKSVKKRDAFIQKNIDTLPLLNLLQGDMVWFKSMTHLHGTLPITCGERYILTIFYSSEN
jgi:hypothetical protein